jgi:hypothetical protein
MAHTVFVTLDYELFFGENQGSARKSILEPTNLLREIAQKTNVRFTFFIDVGYLVQLEKWVQKFSFLESELQAVKGQIVQLIQEGHDCQLHIHPHWERAKHNGVAWVFDYSFYKLSDFETKERSHIIKSYAMYLERLTGQKIHSYRAGGWCIQPFSSLETDFETLGIKIDSSVFKGGKHIDAHYNYDFSMAPELDYWSFQHHECEPDSQGKFIELPISEYTYSPWFFWRLYVLGNLFPHQHKPLGDGKPMPSNMTRLKRLTQKHLLCGGIDGYFASKLNQVVRNRKKRGFEHTVLIGHPKALTRFSLQKLEEFILQNQEKIVFKTFTDFYHEVSN